MNMTNLTLSFASLALLAAAFGTAQTAHAHCDNLDGPLVNVARTAMKEDNVNRVLICVKREANEIVRHAFERTPTELKLSPESRELANMYFFETLVPVHRDGEGVAYTGLKPVAIDFGPSVPATDKALATENVVSVLKLVSGETERGVREHFRKALTQKNFDNNNVQAGRGFVKAYVEYTHYVKRIHGAAPQSAVGHFPIAAGTPVGAHPHKE